MLYGLVNSVILKRGNLKFNSVLKDSKSSTRPVTTHCFTEFAFATEMVFCEDDNKLGEFSSFCTSCGKSVALGEESAHISNLLDLLILWATKYFSVDVTINLFLKLAISKDPLTKTVN